MTFEEKLMELGPAVASKTIQAFINTDRKEGLKREYPESKGVAFIFGDGFFWSETPQGIEFWCGVAHGAVVKTTGSWKKMRYFGFNPSSERFIKGFQLVMPGQMPPNEI